MFESRHYTLTRRILLEVAGVLTIIPLAPFLNRFIPALVVGSWNLDLLAAVVVSFLLVRLLLSVFKPLIIPCLIIIVGLFTCNLFTQGYNFKDVYNDYRSVVVSNWGTRDIKQPDMLNLDPGFFFTYYDKTVRSIRGKINPQDSTVRNFSVRHSLDHYDEYFNKYGPLVRRLSLFKYINNNFKYVSDKARDEYFASPQETIANGLGGDCDDHSILMVSCLEAIGARCRIVLIEGHAYPELFCGTKKEFDLAQEAIIRVFKEYRIREFHYHENNGSYWLNLDYTARHPGGPYINDRVYALIEP